MMAGFWFWKERHILDQASSQASDRHTQIPHMRWKPSEPTLEILELLEEILHRKENNRWCEGRIINWFGELLNFQCLQDIEVGIPTWKLLNRLEILRNVRAESMDIMRNRSHRNGWCAVQRVHQNKAKMKESGQFQNLRGDQKKMVPWRTQRKNGQGSGFLNLSKIDSWAPVILCHRKLSCAFV